jgi:hypothetical protein
MSRVLTGHRTGLLRYFVLTFAVAFAACALPNGNASAAAGQVEGCAYREWSDPTPLESSRPVLSATRFPVLSSMGAGLTPSHEQRTPISYVVGVAGYEAIEQGADSSWPGVWPPQLRVLPAPNTPIQPLPNGPHWYAYPRGVTDYDGALHIVWADANEPPPVNREEVRGKEVRFRSLWYAQLRDGLWSKPVAIFRALSLNWHSLTSSELVVDGAGRLGITFAADDSTGSMLVYLSALSSRTPTWRSHVWRLVAPVTYADVSAGDSGRLAIAFVSAPTPPDTGRDGVYLTQSIDGGATWSSPRRISQTAEQPAIEPHVFVRDSVAEVVWTSQPIASFTGGTVHAVRANLYSAAVNRGAVLPLGGITNGSRAVADECGTVHVVVRALTANGSRIAYSRFASNRWSPIEYPVEARASHPSIAIAGDSLRLIWSSLDTSSGMPSGTLMTATLPLGRRNGSTH